MPPIPVRPESEYAALIAEEERLLAHVQARIATSGMSSDTPMDYDRELIDLRDQLAEAKTEDQGSLVEQMMRMQAIAERRGRSRTLPIDPMAPYFAHLRLSEDGKERDVLIGKRGYIDRHRGVQIVDWRNAPVSQIYYRYEEGDDYDESFAGGRLEGLVVVRRNLSIHGGKLRRIGAPQGVFVRDAHGTWFKAETNASPTLGGGQGLAARPPKRRPGRLGIHGESVPRADKHLPEIAALIDKHQFGLITGQDSGLVVIQGGAGSGKTTVALHRVAYLCYQDPARFKPSKMLVVVPSLALVRYVEGVLPALGVRGVPVVTYRAWASSMRRRLVPGASTRYTAEPPEAVLRLKKHPALIKLLEERVASEADAILRDLPEEIVPKWQALFALPLLPRVRKLLAGLDESGLTESARHVLDAALRRSRRYLGDVLRDREELLSDAQLLRGAFSRHAPGEVTDAEIEALVSWTLKQREEPSEYDGVDPERLQAVDGLAIDSEDIQTSGRLDAEDDAILLRLFELKHGGLVERRDGETRNISYEHIVIDEAQDFAAIDIKVLLEALNPGRSATICGDSRQRLVFDNNFRGWSELLSDTGWGKVSVEPLRLSYRSTAEVMRFARAILGPLAEEGEEPARPGVPVELHDFADLGEAIAFLGEALRSLTAREPMASVAIIARHPEQADLYFHALKRAEVPALRRVSRHDFAFSPGIDVTDVTQVKGLEFDYVILAEATASSYPDSVEARHLLHIAATRTAHQLWVVAVGELSPLLPGELTARTWQQVEL